MKKRGGPTSSFFCFPAPLFGLTEIRKKNSTCTRLYCYLCRLKHNENAMFAFITGKVTEKTPAYVIIDNNGIGYFINITLNTFTAIGEADSVKLYTHEQILEDAHNLFGFFSAKERDLFEM